MMSPERRLRTLETVALKFRVSSDQGSELEACQYLVCLGYLRQEAWLDALDGGSSLPVRSAREAFRRDLVASGWGSRIHPDHDALGPDEVLTLRTLLDLEGEARELPAPDVGSTSLSSRVLNYRLDVYGLIDQPSDSRAFDSSALRGLAELRALLRLSPETSPSELMQSLSDSGWLAKRYIELYGLTPLIIQGEPITEPQAEFEDLVGHQRGFDSAQVRLAVLNTPRLQPARQRLLAELGQRSPQGQERLAQYQQLGRRLLQVRLWVLGYYKGRLDDWIGPLTLQAVRAALLDESARSGSERSLGGLVSIGQGCLAVSTPLLLEGLQAFDLGRHLEPSALADLARQRARQTEREERTWWQRTWSAVVEATKAAIELGRRIYYGVKRILKATVEFVERGLQAVGDLFREGSQFLVQMAQRAFAASREALRKLRDGVDALAGWISERDHMTVAHPQAAVSLPSRDFDLVSLVVDGTTDELAMSHATGYARRLHHFAAAIRALGMAIKILLSVLLAGFSWLTLILQLGSLVETLGSI